MKKISIIILILLMIPSAVFAYTDVEGHWAEKHISNLSNDEIIKGYTDNTFKPDSYITRAELVTIVNRLLNNSIQSYKYIPDVNSNDWYAVEIRKAVYSGIINGDSNDSMRPNDYITREEAVAVLQRAFVENNASHNVLAHKDITEISAWAKDSFYTFIESGYISGYEDYTIRPKANITRAEVCKIIDVIFSKRISETEELSSLYGNVLVNNKNVVLKDIIIDGSLVIAEGTEGNVKLDNIVVNGNLILRAPVEYNSRSVRVKKKVINLYETIGSQKDNEYINNNFGISFSIPDNSMVIEITDETQKIDYDMKNLITMQIVKDENLLYTPYSEALSKEKKKYDSIYKEITKGRLDLTNYTLCKDNFDSYFLFIKRDDVEYIMYFYNAEDYNVVDNVINSIKLFEGENIESHTNLVYKNPKLYLKFSYIDYVGIDDSYNTGVVYKGDAPFKMFIQVNNVTDMSEYSIEEISTVLRALEDSNAEIIKSETNKKVYQYDAVQFDLINESENRMYKSLYVIIETKLYHFIFTGDTDKMQSIGGEIFNNIVNTIEF